MSTFHAARKKKLGLGPETKEEGRRGRKKESRCHKSGPAIRKRIQ
jgi:hypothetical protein